MKKVTVRIRTSFSYLGQGFDGVHVAQSNTTLLHQSQ